VCAVWHQVSQHYSLLLQLQAGDFAWHSAQNYPAWLRAVGLGLGRVLSLREHSPTLYHIHEETEYLS
jgi:hypothetical protein